MEPMLTSLMGLAILLAAAVSVTSTGYLWHIYRGASIKSRFYRRLAVAATIIVVSGVMVVVPAVLALRGVPRLPGTGLLLSVALVIVLLVPAYLAAYVYRLRRAVSREVPPRTFPPATEKD